jgi:hypothetical protein
MSDNSKHLPPLKESRSEISMQDLLAKRAQAEASLVYSREPPTLAEEDNFDVTSSEEPTPRRDLFAHEHKEMSNIENGHGKSYRERPVVETDV